MKITGIYKITSPSNKIYIGQTVDFIKRKSHYKNLKIKSQIRLYNSINKYGWDSRKECAKFINRSEGRVTDLIKIGTWKHYKVENYE